MLNIGFLLQQNRHNMNRKNKNLKSLFSNKTPKVFNRLSHLFQYNLRGSELF
jgi:hypothetical protein